jgi:hypothetical protein
MAAWKSGRSLVHDSNGPLPKIVAEGTGGLVGTDTGDELPTPVAKFIRN